jgi:hypothetical protein
MITFPSTVLLAADGSSHGVNARLAAADITARSGASLHLVHIWRRSTGLLLLPPERNQLLVLSTIPLLVVREDAGAWPPARLVIGDDGSRMAHDAAVLAAHLGRTLGCSVEMVEIVDPGAVEASAPIQVMAGVLDRIDRRRSEIERKVGTPVQGAFRFHRQAASGLREAGSGGEIPVLLAVGHRPARRPGEHGSASIAGRLLADGATTVLICPAPALQSIRRRRAAVWTSR